MIKRKISSLFLNDTYRKLINNGRTYASFTNEELDIIFKDQHIQSKNFILDPMSGYGGLMNHCKTLNISTHNLELNPPAYYWQVLNNPDNYGVFKQLIHLILQNINSLPKTEKFAVASDEYYTTEGIRLTKKLFQKIVSLSSQISDTNSMTYAMSILLPFVFRFSTASNGDVTHIKKGGIAVFDGWKDDFMDYLLAIEVNCIDPNQNNTNSVHKIELGDARSHQFGKKFNAVVTSPPFPNYRDYFKMFAAENFIIDYLLGIKNQNQIIGTNVVKGRESGFIQSENARLFLKRLEAYKGNKKAESDIKVYYLPYFKNYFFDLELVINNIISHLAYPSVCYFAVVNNATRNQIVPVASVIGEIFRKKGFDTDIILTSDVYHVGTKNPHAKGIKAKHTKYIVKAWQD